MFDYLRIFLATTEKVEILSHGKWQTSDSKWEFSWKFLKIENKQIKTAQNNSNV